MVRALVPPVDGTLLPTVHVSELGVVPAGIVDSSPIARASQIAIDMAARSAVYEATGTGPWTPKQSGTEVADTVVDNETLPPIVAKVRLAQPDGSNVRESAFNNEGGGRYDLELNGPPKIEIQGDITQTVGRRYNPYTGKNEPGIRVGLGRKEIFVRTWENHGDGMTGARIRQAEDALRSGKGRRVKENPKKS